MIIEKNKSMREKVYDTLNKLELENYGKNDYRWSYKTWRKNY